MSDMKRFTIYIDESVSGRLVSLWTTNFQTGAERFCGSELLKGERALTLRTCQAVQSLLKKELKEE